MASSPTDLEPVIGLEVHLQLATRSKLFCPCPARFGDPPNRNVCPYCLGHPGTLPVLNREAVERALRLALALGARVARRSRFDRKNYFYPDLPKGYQITQHAEPLACGGSLVIDTEAGPRPVPVSRLHLEEDAGKLVHREDGGGSYALVDFNRAGIPLVECVTAPALRSPGEAHELLVELAAIARSTGASPAHLEEGSLRADANVSLRPRGSTGLGVKVEIKNLNSYRHVSRALAHEIARQRQLLDRGLAVEGETRLWDEHRSRTATLRTKEELVDYRYFPEPDLGPLVLDEAWVERVRAALPELPRARAERLARTHGLRPDEARTLALDGELAPWYEAAVAAGAEPRAAARWALREVLHWRAASGRSLTELPLGPADLARLLARVREGALAQAQAKEAFAQLCREGGRLEDVLARRAARGLDGLADAASQEAAARRVVAAHPAEVRRYHGGKTALLEFFVGATLRELRGRGDPGRLRDILASLLAERPTGA